MHLLSACSVLPCQTVWFKNWSPRLRCVSITCLCSSSAAMRSSFGRARKGSHAFPPRSRRTIRWCFIHDSSQTPGTEGQNLNQLECCSLRNCRGLWRMFLVLHVHKLRCLHCQMHPCPKFSAAGYIPFAWLLCGLRLRLP